MARYTFSELLRIFYQLRKDYAHENTPDNPKTGLTQAEMAHYIGVSLPTLQNWFAGHYNPQRPELVIKLAGTLNLTTLQTDLMLYAINPTWVQYGHSPEVLEHFEIVRYNAPRVPQPSEKPAEPPSLGEIRQTWKTTFEEQFQNNVHRWGVGWKDNGIATLTRTMTDGRYRLTLENRFHDNTFMCGDSACFAPDVYQLQVDARLVEGSHVEDGIGIGFDEVGDESFIIFRLKTVAQTAAVFGTKRKEQDWAVYIDTTPFESIRTYDYNRLAMTVFHQHHWFYINEKLLGYANIPRIPHTRLDIAIVAGNNHTVQAEFKNFVVRVPPLVVHEQ